MICLHNALSLFSVTWPAYLSHRYFLFWAIPSPTHPGHPLPRSLPNLDFTIKRSVAFDGAHHLNLLSKSNVKSVGTPISTPVRSLNDTGRSRAIGGVEVVWGRWGTRIWTNSQLGAIDSKISKYMAFIRFDYLKFIGWEWFRANEGNSQWCWARSIDRF